MQRIHTGVHHRSGVFLLFFPAWLGILSRIPPILVYYTKRSKKRISALLLPSSLALDLHAHPLELEAGVARPLVRRYLSRHAKNKPKNKKIVYIHVLPVRAASKSRVTIREVPKDTRVGLAKKIALVGSAVTTVKPLQPEYT